jgi:prophage regulatory protein
MEQSHPDRILRLAKVLELTGLSRSTLYRKINEGSFPKQVQISTCCIGWRESSVAQWLADPMAWKTN